MPNSEVDGHSVEIEVLVESGNWPEEDQLVEMVNSCYQECKKAAQPELTPEVEMNVLFANDEKMRELNRKWRGIDSPTNVLSFPFEEIGNEPLGPKLGDIVFGSETTLRESVEENKPFKNHLYHLIVHGILHLFGYDHVLEKDAVVMERMERQILASLGIPDPYVLEIKPENG